MIEFPTSFDEGYSAREEGTRLGENPYDPHDDPDKRHEWAEGWRAADFELKEM